MLKLLMQEYISTCKYLSEIDIPDYEIDGEIVAGYKSNSNIECIYTKVKRIEHRLNSHYGIDIAWLTWFSPL
jgi:hypothetical protein